MKINLLNKALTATIQLHGELLGEACYAGYDGTKDDFDSLYAEVYAIARDEVPDEADIDQICETFHDYQLEQMQGHRDIGWYL
jgi:hypothetical protein